MKIWKGFLTFALTLTAFVIIAKVGGDKTSLVTSPDKNPKQVTNFASSHKLDEVQKSNSRQKVTENSQNRKTVDLDSSKKRIDELLKCRSGLCDFAKDDPRSYDLELDRELRNTLNRLSQSINFGTKLNPDLAELLKLLSEESSPFVQEGLLIIMSRLQPDPLLGEIIRKKFLHSVSPQIVQQSLAELLKYRGDKNSALISREIADLIKSGSPIGAKRALKELRHFLNKSNYLSFRKIQRELPSGPLKDQLKSVLDDYLEIS